MREWLVAQGAKVAMGAGAFLFLWLVFPTPYEYTRKAPDIWRVNRFTGVREKSTDNGWRTKGQMDADEHKRHAQQREIGGAAAASEAEQIKLVDTGSWNKIRCENPTGRTFVVKSVLVEYAEVPPDGDASNATPCGRTLLSPFEKVLASSSEDLDISEKGEPPPGVQAVSAPGKKVRQEITVTFVTDFDLEAPYGPFTVHLERSIEANGE